MKKEETTKSCQGCGASIYPEHLQSGIAQYVNDRLLCSHCVKDGEQGDTEADLLEPISFDNDDIGGSRVDMSQSRITTTEDTLGKAGAWDEGGFTRSLDPRSMGATRCRSFHAKLSDNALIFMNNQINDWLDQNDEIVLKFATSTIGQFEGKHTEPNLITTVFY